MPFCWRQFPVISWQLRTIAMLKKEVCHQHKNILHSLSQPIKIKAHQIQMARNTQKVHKGCAKLALTIVKVKATPFIQLFNMSKKIVWKLNVICLIWLIYIYIPLDYEHENAKNIEMKISTDATPLLQMLLTPIFFHYADLYIPIVE